MNPINIYNSLNRRLEEFKPIKKNKVGLYTCGPTVYNYAHIGNLRTYIFEDILKRTLLYNGYKVQHIMNITDVGHLTSDGDVGEDKMEKGAAREHKTAWEIADFYAAAFKKDVVDLNIIPPDEMPRATDHIKEQINLIKKLEKKGFTYKTSDGIYFDTSKLSDYGKLANLKNQSLKAGARVEIGEKKHSTDFALWKFSYPGGLSEEEYEKRIKNGITLINSDYKKLPFPGHRQMEWKSPWGVGFPGWHIECSAMSVKSPGQPFDIHAGGIDHIPVHHTNEIAQSEAATDKPLANYWMHGEFLVIPSGDKMAKSGENFITLQTLKDHGISPLAYRYFVLQTHYRKQLTFSWEALKAAQNGLEHLYSAVRQLSHPSPQSSPAGRGGTIPSPRGRGTQGEGRSLNDQFVSTLNTDLDTPAALALVWQALKEKTISLEQLLKFDEVLGLNIKMALERKEKPLPAEIQKIVNNRDQARNQKDWATSDQLRKKLEEMGYEVKDTKEGTRVSKK